MDPPRSTSPINQRIPYHYSIPDINNLVPSNPAEQMYYVHPNLLVAYNTPFFHHQASDMNTLVPPSFGQQEDENSYGQLHTNINPGYQMDLSVPVMTAINPAGSQMHQDQGYPIPQNYNEPFYNQGFMTHAYQQVMNNPVNQQDAQEPWQQIQVETDGGDEHLIIELEEPNVTTNRSRLRWTPELQRRFNRAVRELGGYFEAKPKEILRRMNVSGITREQLKSHLQKVRKKMIMQTPSTEEIIGPTDQDNTTTPAPQVHSEGEELESPINGEHDRLIRSNETPNGNEIADIALVEEPAPSFSFKDYDWAPNDGQNLGLTLVEERLASTLNFEDVDLTTTSQTPSNNPNLRIAPGEDSAGNYRFEDRVRAPTDNRVCTSEGQYLKF